MKSIIDVHNFLLNEDIQHEMVTMPRETKSAQKVSILLDIPLCEVIKTILFFIDEKPHMVIVPGDKKIDEEKLMKATGAKRIRLADHSEVQKLTGFMVNAMPPFCLDKDIPCIIDHKVLEKDVVYGGGGEIDKIMKIRSADLKRLTQAISVDVAS